MSKYIVKDVVCDCGIYLVDNEGEEELIDICNSKTNAELICEILNADLIKDGKYTIWKDQQIADLNAKLEQLEKEKELNNSFWKQECDSLQQAVEEKELEAIRWEEHFNNAKIDYDCLKEQLAEKENELIGRKKLCDLRYNQLKQAHQDKIELLQAVFNYLEDIQAPLIVVEYIDKKINELKDQK